MMDGCRTGAALPPIEVYELDGRSYVADGNHRVARSVSSAAHARSGRAVQRRGRGMRFQATSFHVRCVAVPAATDGHHVDRGAIFGQPSPPWKRSR
jgi:hypothetical protein